MHAIVQDKLAQIAELCRRHRVKRLELFGSAATAKFDPARSDLDFLVDFSPEADAPWLGEYFELKKDLEALLGRPVDLVMPGAIRNPYFLRSVSATRTLVYAA